MNKPAQSILALDFGTSKFCLAWLRLGNKGVAPSLETISVAAGGMRRGMVANVALAQERLDLLIETAEKKFGIDVDGAIVGIAGSHVSSRPVRTALPIHDEAVTGTHVAQLTAIATEKFKADGREILHTIPIEFRVDDRPPTSHPIGLSGKHLNGTFLLIEASRSYLRDMISMCNKSGLEVRKFMAEPYASSVVTSSEDERRLGVAVCDIGGGTTDGMVYLGGSPFSAFAINVAGHLMTNDLALGLNVSFDEAERLKVMIGLGTEENIDFHIESMDIKGRTVLISQMNVARILRARISELAEMIAREIRSYKGSLGAGVILTGGGSEVLGIEDMLEGILAIPVRIGIPSMRSSANHIDCDVGAITAHPTKLATVLGMLQVELMMRSQSQSEKRGEKGSKYLARVVTWLKEFT